MATLSLQLHPMGDTSVQKVSLPMYGYAASASGKAFVDVQFFSQKRR